uniref:dCTP pyrophosphatase 1 n=1 Tax=Palpitomonas bilix TaxID=652834 RepID=A0A7S3GCT1_9EUKA|mmetsp:Transcript_43753/g.114105  ORF Transcript_43753/g.114105 Transcript_43753/m.114105 type:complete len:124 (+) Transcript_43753:361-732(+)
MILHTHTIPPCVLSPPPPPLVPSPLSYTLMRTQGFTEEEKEHIGEEMSDVLFYLARLADKCGVDLPAAAEKKMAKNRAKYPKDKARGRADKYTAYVSKEEEGKGGEKRKRDETEMRNEQTKSE